MPVSELLKQRLLNNTRKKSVVPSQSSHSRNISNTVVQRALASPHTLQSGDLINLQRTIGNSAVSQMLQRTGQAPSSALTVGPSDDHFEQEANAVANQVAQPGTVQREREPTVGDEGGTVRHDLEQRITRARSGGTPPPETVRRAVGQQTGADFSGVRVHDDQAAHAISDELGAKAATHGKDIFLARNQSPHNLQLMAHEMTHTIQQGAAGSAKRVSSIQRITDEEKIKKLKKKRKRAKAGAGAMKALDVLTTLPLHVIDQLSITDLHLKDFGNFVRTGKTRNQRKKENTLESAADKFKFSKGSAKRALGRTGLRGYLSGLKSHTMAYGGGVDLTLPWNGKLNPFTQMGKGVGGLSKKAKGYRKEIEKIREKQQGGPKGYVSKFKKDVPPPLAQEETVDHSDHEDNSVSGEEHKEEVVESMVEGMDKEEHTSGSEPEKEEEIIESVAQMVQDEEHEEVV